MSFLLDTNVVSEWVKPEPDPNVVAWLADVDEDRVFMSVVTLAEIRRGVELMAAGRRRERLASRSTAPARTPPSWSTSSRSSTRSRPCTG